MSVHFFLIHNSLGTPVCPALALPRYNVFGKAFFTEPQDWTPAQILDYCKEAHISSWFGLKGTNEGVDEEVQIQDENLE